MATNIRDPAAGRTAGSQTSDSTTTAGAAGTARTILFASHRGGSGKTTTAMHVIVALLRQGLRVASIDLAANKATLSDYIENRRRFSEQTGTELPMPAHHRIVPPAGGARSEASEAEWLDMLLDELTAGGDVAVIDTSAGEEALTLRALARADTMITPVANMADLELLGTAPGPDPAAIRLGPFGGVAREEQARRAERGEAPFDWIVVRNRFNPLTPGRQVPDETALENLSRGAGFRLLQGVGDRAIFRDLFREGLTVLDLREEKIKFAMAFAHITARHEMRRLMVGLGQFLPEPEEPEESADEPDEAAPVTRLADLKAKLVRIRRPPPRGDGLSTPGTGAALETTDKQNEADTPAGAADAAHGAQPRILLVLDPTAGRRGIRRFRHAVRQLAGTGCALTVRESAEAGESEALARAAQASGYDAVVAAGGDRAVNEIVTGLADSGVPLGIVPLGRANVIAAAVGLTHHAGALAQAMEAGRILNLRLGRVENRMFAIAASMGFPPSVFADMAPGSAGPGRFWALLLRGWSDFIRHRPARYTVAADGRIFTARGVLIVNQPELIGLPLGDGAGEDPGKDGGADTEEAGFYLCLCAGGGLWRALRYRRALAAGRLAGLPDVEVIRVRNASITATGAPSRGAPVYADGHRVATLPAQFEAANARLRVLAP